MIRTAPFVLALLAAACAPADDGSDPAQAGGAVSESSESAARPAPEVFAATAWRSVSAEGARFSTYLDPDGRYRDLRNGDPWQTGTWRYDSDAGSLLCLKPDADNGVERCWKPGSMRKNVMQATDQDERRIELEKIDYQAPAAADDVPA